ncbi:biotin--[acetyl-CoA-carboxylase] ligase [Paenalcaligenes sp. Me131]|uniref:biotin--[acetyl-CoA-carboxylase] ligase n=1 Tax=Paenalcaligenes sp. Me131 TaxID=3392636 RepID=UPI003D2916A1
MSEHAPSLTSPSRMVSQLRQALPQFRRIEWVDRTDSTNADLLQWAREDNPSLRPWLRGAHLQDRGRGRAGRTWKNREGAHLMFSCAFDIFVPPHALATLSPLCGVVACEALRNLLPERHRVALKLKWPNDLLWYDAKLAGILTEVTRASTAPESKDHHVVVIGIGLNLNDAQSLSESLQRPVADWESISNECADMPAHRPSDLVAAMASGLYTAMNEATAYGFASLPERFSQVDALLGQTINIVHNDKILQTGIAQGVNAQGQLMMRNALGTQVVSVGEVSVRPSTPR